MGSFKFWIQNEKNEVVHETTAPNKQTGMDKLEDYLKSHKVPGGSRHFKYEGNRVPSENK